MKYLVTAEQSIPIPRERAVAVWQAAQEWTKARLADGTLDSHYVFPEGRGGLAIVNADSHETLRRTLVGHPLYAYMDWEVTPLCDWGPAYDSTIEFLQKMG